MLGHQVSLGILCWTEMARGCASLPWDRDHLACMQCSSGWGESLSPQFLTRPQWALRSTLYLQGLCESALAAVTKCHRLGDLNHRDLYPHSPGGWM